MSLHKTKEKTLFPGDCDIQNDTIKSEGKILPQCLGGHIFFAQINMENFAGGISIP